MCDNCGGRGQRFYDHRWHVCDKCRGRGWIYVPQRPHDDWRPRRHHDYGDFKCFVATAAYGTPWEPNVAKLRRFRDQCLMTSPVGQGFVSLYYTASPPLAHWIARRPWARAATRVALTPLVTVAGALTGNPGDLAIVAGAVAFGLLGVPRLKRALRRRRAKA
ncbi:MAG TPA: CFI-box-CTERM domain-containing protein [Planctomycetota bacterium]|nr:CFI-box-CTERM domain-containing protein [Planctomycetota bacterium]